jgi:pyruvate kinase
MGIEYIALSFVQRPEDIKLARELINQNGHPEVGIIAKIEKPSALNYLDEIIKLSDGIMVARGDLGVECPAEKVPSLQKHIINRSRQIGKPVIVATQMLESMVNLAAPTRAEASDVATAVYDAADALMLSAETASGKYPVKAVSIMDKIIRSTESDNFYKERMSNLKLDFNDTAAEAITEAAREVTGALSKVAAIATYTESGSTTLRMARIRL